CIIPINSSYVICYIFSLFPFIFFLLHSVFFFFFNYTATTEIYTLSLHDALPICLSGGRGLSLDRHCWLCVSAWPHRSNSRARLRSEEHTSELQSRGHLVCRLLLEKKKKKNYYCVCIG